MELTILYEDDDIVAVDKPTGVMTHPDGHTTDETVSDWFAARYPASATVGETQRLKDGTEITRPGVVHRLDRDTSGVLVLAKTPESHAYLKQAFHDREAHKTYYAFVYGVPKKRIDTIEFSIGRSRKDFRLRSAQPKAKGMLREAITDYEVLDDIGTHSFLKVMPKTGRTHQIRVHLKAIHHPIVCDPLYKASDHGCDLGFNRLGLHAARLDLPRPDGTRLVLESPLPPELAKAAAKFSELPPDIAPK
jgi:23S rRNA pseudouridine1911/1915/1917 synthase